MVWLQLSDAQYPHVYVGAALSPLTKSDIISCVYISCVCWSRTFCFDACTHTLHCTMLLTYSRPTGICTHIDAHACITTSPALPCIPTCLQLRFHAHYCTLHTHDQIAHVHAHTIHQCRHAAIAHRFLHTLLHHSDELSACTIIIFIQVLALFHRAQVST